MIRGMIFFMVSLVGLTPMIQPAAADAVKSAMEYRISLNSPEDESALMLSKEPPAVQSVAVAPERPIPGPPP